MWGTCSVYGKCENYVQNFSGTTVNCPLAVPRCKWDDYLKIRQKRFHVVWILVTRIRTQR